MLKEISKKSVLGPWLCYYLYIFYSFHNESFQMTSSGEVDYCSYLVGG